MDDKVNKKTDKVIPGKVTDFADLPVGTATVDIPMNLEDLLGRDIILYSYREEKSEYKNAYYALIEARLDDERIEISTGARHVMSQLQTLRSFMPVRVRVLRQGRSFFFGSM